MLFPLVVFTNLIKFYWFFFFVFFGRIRLYLIFYFLFLWSVCLLNFRAGCVSASSIRSLVLSSLVKILSILIFFLLLLCVSSHIAGWWSLDLLTNFHYFSALLSLFGMPSAVSQANPGEGVALLCFFTKIFKFSIAFCLFFFTAQAD